MARLLNLAVLLAAVAVIAGCGTTHAPARTRRSPMSGTAAGGRVARAGARGRAAATTGAPATTAARRTREALARLARRGLPVYCAGRQRPEVALTFDDGPGVYTHLAIRILRRFHVPATWFVVGRNLARFPGPARAERAVGPQEDHTWTHPDLALLPPGAIRHEIVATRDAIEAESHRPVQLFRPPYGARSTAVDAAARRAGLVEVLWTQDSRDSLGATYRQIARNVRAGLHPGWIILLHENHGQTIRALRYLILPALRRWHVEPVTLPTLLATDPPTLSQLRAGPRGCGLPAAGHRAVRAAH